MHANPSHCPNCSFDVASLAIASLSFCPRCQFPIKLLQGRYRIDAKLATGGFGVVYIATDLDTGSKTVAKLIKRDLFDAPGAGVRFLREIEVTARLSASNDHIVRYLGHGEDQELGHYYIMEHLEGQTLDEYLTEKSILSYPDAFHIFRQLCEAVAIAHKQGIVHRDLKPENIFLIEQDDDPLFVKVLDFGIAKIIEGSLEASLTKGVIGTPTYLSPEQCLNNNIDGRSDIYAMGVILYELLTRTLVFNFEGEAMMGVLYKHMNEMPRSMRERRPDLAIPAKLDEVVLRALKKQPKDRWDNVGDFWAALQPFVHLRILATQVEGSSADNLLPKFGNNKVDKPAAFMPTMLSTDERQQKQAYLDETEPQPPVVLSRQDSTLPTGSLETSTPTPRRGRVVRPPTPHGMSGQMLTKESRPTPKSNRTLSVALIVLVVILLGALGWIALHQKNSVVSPPPRTVAKPNKRNDSLRDALQVGLSGVDSKEDAGNKKAGLPESDPDDDVQEPPKPRPRARRKQRKPRIRARRRRRRRARRRVLRRVTRKRSGPCGRPPSGKYHIYARLGRPRGKRVRIRIYRCSSCRTRRYKGGYCLTVPKRLTRIRLRISVEGYLTCKHRLGANTPKVLWKLKEFDPEDLMDETYRCYSVVQ